LQVLLLLAVLLVLVLQLVLGPMICSNSIFLVKSASQRAHFQQQGKQGQQQQQGQSVQDVYCLGWHQTGLAIGPAAATGILQLLLVVVPLHLLLLLHYLLLLLQLQD
jgi:hypothetical protein